MALTESQIYALNTLTYAGFDDATAYIGGNTADALMQQAVEQGWTVGEYVQSLQNEFGEHSSRFDSAFEAILNDPTVSSMHIQAHQHMDGSDANMIVFTSEAHSEAVVAFEGSQSTADWFDNFAVVQNDTGTADGVSSECQVAANDYFNSPEIQAVLSQYDTVTTTGHSKGGNNATYCAIMNNSVDRSITFDAPGYTDAFYEKYADRIAQAQDRVSNYSADCDIVNAVLNSVGDQHYIRRDLPDGYDNCIDSGDSSSFLSGHDVTALEDFFFGNAPEVSQDPGVAALDRFVNSFLREYPDSADELFRFADHLANIDWKQLQDADNIFEKAEALFHLIFDTKRKLPNVGSDLSNLLGHLIVYMEANPGDMYAILNLLEPYYPDLVDCLRFVVDHWNDLWLQPIKYRFLKDIIQDARKQTSDGFQSSADLKVQSAGYSGSISTRTNEKVFNTDAYRDLARRLNRINDELQGCRSVIDRAASMCDKVDFRLSLSLTATLLSAFKTVLSGTAEHVLRGISGRVGACASELDDMAHKMRQVAAAIEDQENNLTDAAHSIKIEGTAPYANA